MQVRKATPEMIAIAASALARGYRKGEVKRLLRSAHAAAHPGGTVGIKTLEKIITAARRAVTTDEPARNLGAGI